MTVCELEEQILLSTDAISVSVGTEASLLNIWQEVDVYVTRVGLNSSPLTRRKQPENWDRKHFLWRQRDSVDNFDLQITEGQSVPEGSMESVKWPLML